MSDIEKAMEMVADVGRLRGMYDSVCADRAKLAQEVERLKTEISFPNPEIHELSEEIDDLCLCPGEEHESECAWYRFRLLCVRLNRAEKQAEELAEFIEDIKDIAFDGDGIKSVKELGTDIAGMCRTILAKHAAQQRGEMTKE
jgi:predicted RNase H-like nuclease (RuvC/YqgF family)